MSTKRGGDGPGGREQPTMWPMVWFKGGLTAPAGLTALLLIMLIWNAVLLINKRSSPNSQLHPIWTNMHSFPMPYVDLIRSFIRQELSIESQSIHSLNCSQPCSDCRIIQWNNYSHGSVLAHIRHKGERENEIRHDGRHDNSSPSEWILGGMTQCQSSWCHVGIF